MNAKNVVLVTSTFYKDVNEPRAVLAIRTCKAAKEAGYSIIVVDGSPLPEFKALLQETGATVLDEAGRGMGASRRQALQAALDTEAEVIIWLEPEKAPIVPLLGPCIEPILNKRADVVIPRRRNLDGYPDYQRTSELRANWELGNITDRPDIDFYIGPRVMDRRAAVLMLDYDPSDPDAEYKYGDNWEILFIPLLWWLSRSMIVDSVVVDYVHPPEQKIEDDETMRVKRDKQFNDLVTCMTAEAKRIGIRGMNGMPREI